MSNNLKLKLLNYFLLNVQFNLIQLKTDAKIKNDTINQWFAHFSYKQYLTKSTLMLKHLWILDDWFISLLDKSDRNYCTLNACVYAPPLGFASANHVKIIQEKTTLLLKCAARKFGFVNLCFDRIYAFCNGNAFNILNKLHNCDQLYRHQDIYLAYLNFVAYIATPVSLIFWEKCPLKCVLKT